MQSGLINALKSRIIDVLQDKNTKEEYKNRLLYIQAVLNSDIDFLKQLAPKKPQEKITVQKIQTFDKKIQTDVVNEANELVKQQQSAKKSKADQKHYSEDPYDHIPAHPPDLPRQKKLSASEKAAERAIDKEARANKQMTIQTAQQMKNDLNQPQSSKNQGKTMKDQINDVQKAFDEASGKSAPKADSQSPEVPERKNKVQLILESEGVLLSADQLKDFSLQNIHGMQILKDTIAESILLPQNFPDLCKGLQVHRKFLLHSLPGCGKTFFVKCIAGQCGYSLVQVTPSVIFSKYQGQSEKLIKGVFELARASQPCILFLDELDSICGKRTDSDSESARRVKNEILVQMDAVSAEQKILVIGATNLPLDIDSAVRRRFEKRIYVQLPDDEARKAMFQTWITIQLDGIKDKVISDLTSMTEGYSGADISNICKSLNFLPVKKLTSANYFFLNSENKYEICDEKHPKAVKTKLMELSGKNIQTPSITYDHIIETVSKIKSSVRKEELEQHKAFQNQFGSE